MTTRGILEQRGKGRLVGNRGEENEADGNLSLLFFTATADGIIRTRQGLMHTVDIALGKFADALVHLNTILGKEDARFELDSADLTIQQVRFGITVFLLGVFPSASGQQCGDHGGDF